MSLLVPVFTALQPRVASGFSSPKLVPRAPRSARMSVTIQAAPGSSTCRLRPAGAGKTCGRDHVPPTASVR